METEEQTRRIVTIPGGVLSYLQKYVMWNTSLENMKDHAERFGLVYLADHLNRNTRVAVGYFQGNSRLINSKDGEIEDMEVGSSPFFHRSIADAYVNGSCRCEIEDLYLDRFPRGRRNRGIIPGFPSALLPYGSVYHFVSLSNCGEIPRNILKKDADHNERTGEILENLLSLPKEEQVRQMSEAANHLLGIPDHFQHRVHLIPTFNEEL